MCSAEYDRQCGHISHQGVNHMVPTIYTLIELEHYVKLKHKALLLLEQNKTTHIVLKAGCLKMLVGI